MSMSILSVIITVRSSESSTQCWHRSTSTYDKLVRLTLVVCALRLTEDHVVQVEPVTELVEAGLVQNSSHLPNLAHVCGTFVDG